MENTIKNYWDERAKQNQSKVTGTTDDVYLRELEINTFCSNLKQLGIKENSQVLDIGCGDGYTTLHIAKAFPNSVFRGVDYSESMIANAQVNLKRENVANISFGVADATKIQSNFGAGKYDFVLTDRCLINLENSEAQYDAISKISSLIKPGGYYLAIENFIDGQNNLNEARTKMGLNPIPIRWHNLFFKEDEFLANVKRWFSSVEIIEFSSAYYYATRVVYSAMCKLEGVEPDYLHSIHKIAIDLPIIGKFSPIRLALLKK